MLKRSARLRIALTLTGLALCALPAAAAAASPGATSLGDPLFPQIGNGGYDALNYDLDLNVDPNSNTLLAGTATTIDMRATQDLSSFSLDFQRDLDISSVTVDGQPAAFNRADATPKFSNNPKVTQPAKLFITPTAPIPSGTQFTVQVAYSGVPKPIVDADLSDDGWVRACSSPGHCNGSFAVGEPIGAQTWFPCNDYMTDKATFSTSITVPDGFSAFGAGELTSKVPGPNGTTTWNWTEAHPTATYLTSASVGRYDYDGSASFLDQSDGRTLPINGAIDSTGSPKAKQRVMASTKRLPSMINFLSKLYGPYPFDSVGYVAGWLPDLGYALENETKPHFAGDEKGPSIPADELLHEQAHQWMGDDVSPRTWQQVWFNEGWATFSKLYWAAKHNGAKSPRHFLRTVLSAKRSQFARPPADLGSPAYLFDGFAVYSRPAAMLEGLREILGNKRFFSFAKLLTTSHAYSTISEQQFVDDAITASGYGGSDAKRLRAYFRQWLDAKRKPTLTPSDF